MADSENKVASVEIEATVNPEGQAPADQGADQQPNTAVPNDVGTGPVDGGQPAQEDPVATQAPAATEAPVATSAPTPEPTPTPTPAATPAPTVAPTPTFTAPPATSAPAAVGNKSEDEKAFDEHIELILAAGTAAEQHLATYLTRYVQNMAPGKIMTEQAGGTEQALLWSAIVNVVRNEAEFEALFSLLLGFFRRHRILSNGERGALHEGCTFRHMDSIPLDGDRTKAFQRMLNLLTIASQSPNHRHTLAQVDINRTMANGVFNDEERQRVFNYFSV